MLFCLLLNKLGEQIRLFFTDANRLLGYVVVVNEAYVGFNHGLLGKLDKNKSKIIGARKYVALACW